LAESRGLESHRWEEAVNPAKTHAIVVGIEQYKISDKWNLNGPALDAADFIQWLLSCGVPPNNIAFFATPLEKNRARLEAPYDLPDGTTVGIPYRPPESKTITDAIADDFAARKGDFLFLMWGGHGVTSKDSRRLFFSDVSANRLLSLDMQECLTYLRSTLMQGFDRQAIFLDACANYFELQQSQVGLTSVPMVPGLERGKVRQFVLYSASKGERAKNLDGLSKGLFSSILIEELKRLPPTEWPPNLPVAESRVQMEFDALRDEGNASQTPVHFYYQDWEGHGKVFGYSNEPRLSPAERELADALMLCPVMRADNTRSELLGELRALRVSAVDQIIFVPEMAAHVELIVAVLSRSGDRGTLIVKVLERTQAEAAANRLEQVRLEIEQQLFDFDTVTRIRSLLEPVEVGGPAVMEAFQECARDLDRGSDPAQRSVYSLLMKLAGYGKQSNGFPYPALLFAETVAGLLPGRVASELKECVDIVARRRNVTEFIADFRAGRAWQNTPGFSTLVVEIKPKGGGFTMRASLLNSVGQWTPLLAEDSPISRAAIQERFRRLVLEADQRPGELRIEMAVSREMFSWDVDRWEIDKGGYPVVVGAHFPVVLRWLDRMGNKQLHKPWSEKWKHLDRCTQGPFWLAIPDQYQPGQLLAIFDNPVEGAYVGVAFHPAQGRDLLSVAMSGGTAVAVWCRACKRDSSVAMQELAALLKKRVPKDLPELVHTIRNEAERLADAGHPGTRIALLYDDYTHLPPQL
jgi:hypothetical protein